MPLTRHSFYPYFKGISKAAYDKLELESIAKKSTTYHGEKISIYEATQQQRYFERGIRKWKRQAGALEAAGLDNAVELSKVREWQSRMRNFINQTRLDRQYVRERIL